MIKNLLKGFLFVFFVLSAFFLSQSAVIAADLKLYFDQSSYNVSQKGDTVDVELKIDSGDNRVDLASVRLNYDSGVEIKNIDLGELPNKLNVNYENGEIVIEAVKMSKWKELPSGEFILANLEVQVDSNGKIEFKEASVNGCTPSGSECRVKKFNEDTGGPVEFNTTASSQKRPKGLWQWILKLFNLL